AIHLVCDSRKDARLRGRDRVPDAHQPLAGGRRSGGRRRGHLVGGGRADGRRADARRRHRRPVDADARHRRAAAPACGRARCRARLAQRPERRRGREARRLDRGDRPLPLQAPAAGGDRRVVAVVRAQPPRGGL
ncbi:MAG: hypothetical protein AVDCRST_MAG85-1793, partial [uncultured Solirubrobacteraceae bacterium]